MIFGFIYIWPYLTWKTLGEKFLQYYLNLPSENLYEKKINVNGMCYIFMYILLIHW